MNYFYLTDIKCHTSRVGDLWYNIKKKKILKSEKSKKMGKYKKMYNRKRDQINGLISIIFIHFSSAPKSCIKTFQKENKENLFFSDAIS